MLKVIFLEDSMRESIARKFLTSHFSSEEDEKQQGKEDMFKTGVHNADVWMVLTKPFLSVQLPYY